jgi:hypothetical protein
MTLRVGDTIPPDRSLPYVRAAPFVYTLGAPATGGGLKHSIRPPYKVGRIGGCRAGE